MRIAVSPDRKDSFSELYARTAAIAKHPSIRGQAVLAHATPDMRPEKVPRTRIYVEIALHQSDL